MSGQTNDVIVAKDIGYLRATTEANTKNITEFYELLSNHMEKEEKERKVMDHKMSAISIALVWLIVKDTEVAGNWFTNILGLFIPGL